jgi:hypothetical protein
MQIAQIANATRKNLVLVVEATPGKNRQHLNQRNSNYNANPRSSCRIIPEG